MPFVIPKNLGDLALCVFRKQLLHIRLGDFVHVFQFNNRSTAALRTAII